jgi:transcriptional regulator with XRE-family HTH domain
VTTTTKTRKLRRFPGRDLVADLMAELDRLAVRERIAGARKEAGLRQHELAEILNVTPRTVQNWESAKHPITPPWDRMDEISAALGVTKTWLLHGDEQPVGPVPLLQEAADGVASLLGSQEDVLGLLREIGARLERVEDALERDGVGVSPRNRRRRQ